MLLRNGVFMEFKRIDDTKFQCLLDEDDLEDNNISLDDFFRNDTKKIHGLLDVILEEAQKSIGIMMDGGVMSLQLAPQPNHTILLTISSGHDEFSDMIRNAGMMITLVTLIIIIACLVINHFRKINVPAWAQNGAKYIYVGLFAIVVVAMFAVPVITTIPSAIYHIIVK